MCKEYREDGEESIDCPYANDYHSPFKKKDVRKAALMVRQNSIGRCLVYPMCKYGGQYQSCSRPEDFILVHDLFIDDCKDSGVDVFTSDTLDGIEYNIGNDGYITKIRDLTLEKIRLDTVEEFIEDLRYEKELMKRVCKSVL